MDQLIMIDSQRGITWVKTLIVQFAHTTTHKNSYLGHFDDALAFSYDIDEKSI